MSGILLWEQFYTRLHLTCARRTGEFYIIRRLYNNVSNYSASSNVQGGTRLVTFEELRRKRA